MWKYNSDFKKWGLSSDSLSKGDFDFLRRELYETRYFSKSLSGATFVPVNNLDDIYDILGEWEPRNWYVSPMGSRYVDAASPANFFKGIDLGTSYEYYSKFLAEYGLTLKSLFTADRLIKDSVKNYIQVDAATSGPVELAAAYPRLVVDGVALVKGNRVLVKDQRTTEVLGGDIDPAEYFLGGYTAANQIGGSTEYTYYNAENGIYVYDGSYLVKQSDFDDYGNCVRCSVYVNMGSQAGKQFHLRRLSSGYFPTSLNQEPMEFSENHNWLLRNRVDYNNLFEINYYDVMRHATQSYQMDGVTYSIPQRTIAVGEFGVILNTQAGVSNIIYNKYKVNLRSVAETTRYYWVCGDDSTLLRVRKHDFAIESVRVDSMARLTSVSFFNELRGVVVGEMNTILMTLDAGQTWRRLRIDEFSAFTYYKAVFADFNRVYVCGRNGVFLEISEGVGGWTAYRRRISRQVDEDDEYLLVDNINDLYLAKYSAWGLSYSYRQGAIGADKTALFMCTDNGNVVVHDVSGSTDFDFLYLDFGKSYGNVRNIAGRAGTNDVYFTADGGLYKFALGDFTRLGVDNSYSNAIAGTAAALVSGLYANEIFDYAGQELMLCGNESLLVTATYGGAFAPPDPGFESRLTPKMLFMDYDIGSKLNFFTDQGEYRMPSSVTFSAPATGFTFSMRPLVNAAVAPSYVTQSEVNWWSYQSDALKTYAFGSSAPLTAASRVLPSATFSYNSKYSEFGVDSVNTSESDIHRIAAGITYSRYTRLAAPVWPVSTSMQTVLYLSGYLAVLDISTFSVSVGDTIRLESDVVDASMVVNRVVATSSSQYPGGRSLVYMYSEFNEAIISDLSGLAPGKIKVRNLNRFKTPSQFAANFNAHPIGAGYRGATQSGNVVRIDPLFNPTTAYYNMASAVVVNGSGKTMSYTDGFLKFGYTGRYNLLDYMEGMNSKLNPERPLFYASKEYFAMPVYRGIPIDSLTSSTVYMDPNDDSKLNRVLFGDGLKLEWESLLVNTFVDLSVYGGSQSGTYSSDRMLVMSKYELPNYDGQGITAYAIEFQKRIQFGQGVQGLSLDIVSRRRLDQISQDLQELNNIQRPLADTKSFGASGGAYTYGIQSYSGRLNFKIPTDSYAKIMLSDVDTVSSLSALVYVDYKNELAMNVTRLDREYSVPILNTVNYGGRLYIKCKERHGLSKNSGFVLEFGGGTYSSQSLNQQYFGYHYADTVVNEYDFITELPYGQDVFVGNDVGYVRYVKNDPFLNYQPVDIIDVGVDKKGKRSIELGPENLKLTGDRFSLVDVDFERYRLRLVDGMNVEILSVNYPWLLEAEVSGAVIGMDAQQSLIWYKGVWESGRWFGGNWVSGTWKGGDWYGGVWDSKSVTDKKLSVEVNASSDDSRSSVWHGGRWYDGTWKNGTWVSGRWYGGEWLGGEWYNGIWNDGQWRSGRFIGGIWVAGTWDGGVFSTDNEPAFWIDGTWNGGDFENGMWYNGIFGELKAPSTFGKGAFNSRTATWHSGRWVSGGFHSGATGPGNASDVHKYSIWYTGQWFSGTWHGGVAYNTTFNSGTWNGGILEEIQVIGINDANKSFILNGLFRFNIGDEICVIDNNAGGDFSVFGSNSEPGRYTVLKVVRDEVNRLTEVYVDLNFSAAGLSDYSKYSGELNLPIPAGGTALVSTQSVAYNVSGTTEIAVRVSLSANHVGDLTVNLRAPNGNVINLKQYGMGGTSSTNSGSFFYKNPNQEMVDTILSTTQSLPALAGAHSPYTGRYSMPALLGEGAAPYSSNVGANWPGGPHKALLNPDGTMLGDWALYIKDVYNYSLPSTDGAATASAGATYSLRLAGDRSKSLRVGDTLRIAPKVANSFATFSSVISGMKLSGQFTVLQLSSRNVTGSNFNLAGATNSVVSGVPVDGRLVDWEIKFYNGTQIGAEMGKGIENGFDTGLRVVSDFKNCDWKSGIWTNGIYGAGNFGGGIWYNGVFGADWGDNS